MVQSRKESTPYNNVPLEDALRGLGYELKYIPKTESTMDDAVKLGIKPAVVLTDHQTRGRGRLGRKWLDEPGKSVLMTVVEPFNETDGDPDATSTLPYQLFTLSAAIGLSIVTGNSDIEIKWPNDLVYKRRKIGGVLVENPDYSSQRTYPKLFGIGINYDYPSADETFPETDYGAISLTEIAGEQKFSRDEVVLAIISRWSQTRRDIRALQYPNVFEKYDNLWKSKATALQNRRVRVVGINRDPNQSVEGIVKEPVLGKALLLSTSVGIKEVAEFTSLTRVEVI